MTTSLGLLVRMSAPLALAATAGCAAAEFATDGTPPDAAQAAISQDAIAGGKATGASAPGGAGSSGNGDAGATPDGAADAEDGGFDAVAACADGSAQRLVQRVAFPDPGVVCAWEQEGNLGRRDRHIQARREQSVALALPDGAVLCRLALATPEQPMRYDDQIFLLLNQVGLLASHSLNPPLATEDDFLIYDWTRLVGQQFDPVGYQPWCAGVDAGSSDCSMPNSESNGVIRMRVEPEALLAAAVKAGMLVAGASAPKKARAGEFRFVTIGDNDGTDCRHSDFAFEVEALYVMPL